MAVSSSSPSLKENCPVKLRPRWRFGSHGLKLALCEHGKVPLLYGQAGGVFRIRLAYPVLGLGIAELPAVATFAEPGNRVRIEAP
jgi:hypothetical protein